MDVLEQHIDSITARLEGIQREVVNLKRVSSKPEKLSLVIEADPSFPPESVRTILKYLSTLPISTTITTHRHSSLTKNVSLISNWLTPQSSGQNRIDNQFNLTWIWKPIGCNPIAKEVHQSNSKEFLGEGSIARLLARFIESWTRARLYENLDAASSAQIDEWLDLVGDKSIMKRLESRLSRCEWLVGGSITLADYVVASSVKDRLTNDRLKEWAQRCCSL